MEKDLTVRTTVIKAPALEAEEQGCVYRLVKAKDLRESLIWRRGNGTGSRKGPAWV